MTKLKTLKDIGETQELQSLGSQKKWKTPRMIYEEELRQEVIEWIKEIKIKNKDMQYFCFDCMKGLKDVDEFGNHNSMHDIIDADMWYSEHSWIKYFFNFNDEELK